MKTNSIKMLLLTVLIVLLLVPAAFAEKLEFAPTADASMSSADRDAAQNTDILACQWADVPDSGTIHISWIKFDIQGIGSNYVENARLEITQAGDVSGLPPAILIVTAPNDWQEESLNWNNHPKMNEQIASGWISSESADGATWTFPIPPSLINTGELTLALVPQPGDSSSMELINFYSSSGAVPPLLYVNTINEEPTEIEIDCTGDLHVNGSNPDGTALGGVHIAIAVKLPTIYGLMKFDISPLAGLNVIEATLELTQDQGSGFHNGPTIALRTCSPDWDEFNTSWNTRPAAESFVVGGLMQDTAIVASGTVFEWSIVPEAFAGKTELSFYLMAQPGNELWWGWDGTGIYNDATFSSLDGSYPPLLRVKTTSTTAVNPEENIAVANTFKLHQNYPNPFNPETKISYQISSMSDVRLEVFNTVGQSIRILENGSKSAGMYNVVWDGLDSNGNKVSSGIYFYRLSAKSGSKQFTESKKLILMK